MAKSATKTVKPLANKARHAAGAKSTRARNRRSKALMGEAIALATAQGIPTSFDGAPPSLPNLLDQVLARTIDIWRFAAHNADQVKESEFWVDGFDAVGNKITEPNKWFQLEQAARAEAFEMLESMTSLDIDERRVRIEEFQLEVLGRALRAAARDTGLTTEQQQELGQHLRRHVALIEGITPEQQEAGASPTRRTDSRIKELEAPLVE